MAIASLDAQRHRVFLSYAFQLYALRMPFHLRPFDRTLAHAFAPNLLLISSPHLKHHLIKSAIASVGRDVFFRGTCIWSSPFGSNDVD